MKRPSFQFNPQGWKSPNSYSDDFAPLPRGSGVYLLVHPKNDDLIILYVGMSKNIEKRIRRHNVMAKVLEQVGYVQVFFKEFSENLRAIEKGLIKKFNPPYNLQHRTIGL